jgi:hypothetical protein
MSQVFFKFRPDVSDDEQRSTLRVITAWPEVGGAGPLNPGAPTPDMRRTYFVQVHRDPETEGIADRLRGMPQVAIAQVPPQRRLVY